MAIVTMGAVGDRVGWMVERPRLHLVPKKRLHLVPKAAPAPAAPARRVVGAPAAVSSPLAAAAALTLPAVVVPEALPRRAAPAAPVWSESDEPEAMPPAPVVVRRSVDVVRASGAAPAVRPAATFGASVTAPDWLFWAGGALVLGAVGFVAWRHRK